MKPESARRFIDVHGPVAAALAAGRPVVALESTIITHGMPYPDNGAMAAQVEKIILDEGAVPATIAVINGRIKIGLSDGERESLAMTADALKLSRADLAFAVAEGRTGGTTVAATMICAALAGIKVFATGGIGGVHRPVAVHDEADVLGTSHPDHAVVEIAARVELPHPGLAGRIRAAVVRDQDRRGGGRVPQQTREAADEQVVGAVQRYDDDDGGALERDALPDLDVAHAHRGVA